MIPPFASSAWAPKMTLFTLDIRAKTHESGARVTLMHSPDPDPDPTAVGPPSEASTVAMRWPAYFGAPSATTTLKLLFCRRQQVVKKHSTE